MAAVYDLTAFVLAWPIEDRVAIYPWFFIPEDGLAERVRRDNVPYDRWVKDGLVEATPGAVTDWRFVTARIKQLAHEFDIVKIGFDRQGARDVVSDLNDAHGAEWCEDIGQGYASMSAPSKRLQELVLSRRLIHSGHPVLRWNVDCTAVSQDPAGNIKPVKPDRQRGSKRIDGVVATVMAMDGVMRNTDGGDFYKDGLMVLG